MKTYFIRTAPAKITDALTFLQPSLWLSSSCPLPHTHAHVHTHIHTLILSLLSAEKECKRFTTVELGALEDGEGFAHTHIHTPTLILSFLSTENECKRFTTVELGALEDGEGFSGTEAVNPSVARDEMFIRASQASFTPPDLTNTFKHLYTAEPNC